MRMSRRSIPTQVITVDELALRTISSIIIMFRKSSKFVNFDFLYEP